MIFEQIPIGGSYQNVAYIIGDELTRECVTVDVGRRPKVDPQPVFDRLGELGVRVKYNLATHSHSDHMGDRTELKAKTGAPVAACQAISGVDLPLNRGDVLQVGSIQIEVISTPGHTSDSVCYLVNQKKLLTGDTLFVGRVPKVDNRYGGDLFMFFHVLHHRILTLDDEIEVWPGHDIGSTPNSTIGEERKNNYVLNMSREDFCKREWDPIAERWYIPIAPKKSELDF